LNNISLMRKSGRFLYSMIPIRYRLGNKYFKLKEFLRNAQWWDISKIHKWQLHKLKFIITYAYENTAGYFELYNNAGVNQQDIVSLEDIEYLPFTSKTLIRDNLKDFSIDTYQKWKLKYVSTGGSTGIPFGFYHIQQNTWTEAAFMHSGWERKGWQIDEKSVVLRGGFIGSEDNLFEFNPIRNELSLSIYYLTENNLEKYIKKIYEFKPLNIQAYPSAMYLFSKLYLSRNKRILELNVSRIFLGSENIYKWQLKEIRAAFPKAEIFSWLGHAEQAVLGHWCEFNSFYHIWPFYGIMELLDNVNQEVGYNETGEIVGTSFWNIGTPFIRYRTMDMGRKDHKSCNECGRNFLMINKIEGRLQEYIITKSGRHISMAAINMHSDVFINVKQFQFYQAAIGEMSFRLIPNQKFTKKDRIKIKTELAKKLGNEVDLEISMVHEIKRSKSGQYSFLDQQLDLT